MELQFFSSLALTKTTSTNKSPSTFDFQNAHSSPSKSSVGHTPQQVSPLKNSQNSPSSLKAQTLQESTNNNKDLSKSINDLNLNTQKDNTISPIQTCFVRNFNSIPQFEEKINKREPAFSYETIDEEYEEDNYDDAEYDDEYYDHNNELYCDNELEEGEIESKEDETAKDMLDAPNDDENSCQKPNSGHEWFLKEFTDEIRQTIKIVLALW